MVVINNEEKLVTLKKLEMSGTGQICYKLNELDSQDGVVGMQAELV